MTTGPERARQRRMGQMGRFAALLLLAGCATAKPPETVSPKPITNQELAALQSYSVSRSAGTQCVPYARARTGIGIFGDAHTWWETAAGQYARGNQPMVGSVLVLRKTNRLRHGHLGVVANVVGPREIRVDHANWQRGAIITNMAVIDVSEANDWSQLRFWNKDAREWGSVYPAAGFIYNVPDSAALPKGTGTTIVSRSGNLHRAADQAAP